MPISNEKIRSGPFTPNGVTTRFSYDFYPQSEAEILVTLTDPVTQVSTPLSGWSASAIRSPGEVVFDEAPETDADGKLIYIWSNPNFQQPQDFENQGPFNPKDHNFAADLGDNRSLWLRGRLRLALIWGGPTDNEGNPVDDDGNPVTIPTFPPFTGPYIWEYNDAGVVVAFRSVTDIIQMAVDASTSEVTNILTEILDGLSGDQITAIITVLESTLEAYTDTQILRITEATDTAIATIEAYSTTQINALAALIATQMPVGYAIDVGIVNALSIVMAPVPTAEELGEGATWRIKVAVTNTGAATLTVNGTTAMPIRYRTGEALDAGAMVAGGLYWATNDGAVYRIDKDKPSTDGGEDVPDFTADFANGWERRGDVLECWGVYTGGSTIPPIAFGHEFLVAPDGVNGVVTISGYGTGNVTDANVGDATKVSGVIPLVSVRQGTISSTGFQALCSEDRYDTSRSSNVVKFTWRAVGKWKP